MANSTGKVVEDNEAVTSLKTGSKKELWMINTRSRGASSIHSNIQHSASHQDNQTLPDGKTIRTAQKSEHKLS